jgi:hypothetical protein
MTAYVPPWLQYGPESNASSISSGLGAATRFAEVKEQHSKDQNEALNAGVAAIQNLRQLQMQKQQFAQKQKMDMLQLQTNKEQSDRQFQLDQQQVQNAHALAQQTLDLGVKTASQQFQWQQQYQQRVKQLVQGRDKAPSSADQAAADLSGETATGDSSGMDYSAASAQALSEIGPRPGSSMAGFGTVVKSMTPPRVPAPLRVVTDPQTGDRAWSYGNQLKPIPAHKDTSTQDAAKETATERKDKINFVNTYLKNNPNKELDDAQEAWTKMFGKDAALAGGTIEGSQGFAKLSSGNGGRIVPAGGLQPDHGDDDSWTPSSHGAGGSWTPSAPAAAYIPAAVAPPTPAPAPEATGIPGVDEEAKQEAQERQKKYQDEVDKQKSDDQSKAEERVHLLQEQRKEAIDTTKDNISYWKNKIKNLSSPTNMESQAKSATTRAAEINILKKKISDAEESLVNPYE